MKINFDIDGFVHKIDRRSEKAMVVIGNQAVSWTSDRIRFNDSVVTGNLVNSITYSTFEKQGDVKGGTNGTKLGTTDAFGVLHFGTNVVYALRVEYGFVGTDSLGRTYNQKGKSYLRATLLTHGKDMQRIYVTAMKGQTGGE